MNINRSNYEMYIIDYLDGKLDAVAVSELLLFIEQYPEIKKEFNAISGSLNAIPEFEILDKTFLKKPVYQERKAEFESLLIAKLEGDLNKDQLNEVEKLLVVYPEMNRDNKLFAQTISIAENTIVFEDKRLLKKQMISVQFNYKLIWRAAAIFLISLSGFLLGIYLLDKPDENRVAERVTHKVKVPEKRSHVQTSVHENRITKSISGRRIKMRKAEDISHPIIPLRPVLLNEINPLNTSQILAENRLNLKYDTSKIRTQIHLAVNQPAGKEEFRNLPQFAMEEFKAGTNEILVEKNKPDSAVSINAATYAGLYLLKFYNRISGDDAKVVKKYDNSGKLSGYAIVANNFQYSHGK